MESPLGVTLDFCHTSNEITRITISRLQNDQTSYGICMIFEQSPRCDAHFCHTSNEITRITISRLQNDQKTYGISIFP